MTIWILALVLLASGAGLGFRHGAIRVGISFIGVVIATLFAGLLGNQLKPLFPRIGRESIRFDLVLNLGSLRMP